MLQYGQLCGTCLYVRVYNIEYTKCTGSWVRELIIIS